MASKYFLIKHHNYWVIFIFKYYIFLNFLRKAKYSSNFHSKIHTFSFLLKGDVSKTVCYFSCWTQLNISIEFSRTVALLSLFTFPLLNPRVNSAQSDSLSHKWLLSQDTHIHTHTYMNKKTKIKTITTQDKAKKKVFLLRHD